MLPAARRARTGPGRGRAESGFGAGEAAVHGGECGRQFIGRFWVAQLDKAAAAPAGEVGVVERKIGVLVTAGTLADLACRGVEGVAAGGLRRPPRRPSRLRRPVASRGPDAG